MVTRLFPLKCGFDIGPKPGFGRTDMYMKIKRMGLPEILRRIWLFSANKIKSSESFSRQPAQLIVELNSSLRQIIDSVRGLYKKITHL